MTDLTPVMTAAELNTYIQEVYPQIYDQLPGFEVLKVGSGTVTVRIVASERHIRAGGTLSGPTLFALADMGGYACALSHIGREALTVTTNLNINFMRKAEIGPLDAECRILKLGKRLMVFDASMKEAGKDAIVAHATGTYAIPPR